MPDPVTYDVRSQQTGAVVICGVDLDTARDEKARLNAEARVLNTDTGKPVGMDRGEVTRYIITTRAGIAV